MNNSEGLKIVKEILKSLSYIEGFDDDALSVIRRISQNPKSKENVLTEENKSQKQYRYYAQDNGRERAYAKILMQNNELESMTLEVRYFKRTNRPFELGSITTNNFEIERIIGILRVIKDSEDRIIFKKNGFFSEVKEKKKTLQYYKNQEQISSMNVSPLIKKEDVLKRLRIKY